MQIKSGTVQHALMAVMAGASLLVSGVASAEWYVGARAGLSIVDKGSDATTTELRAMGEPNVTADVDDSDTAATLYGGYKIDGVIAIEASLYTLGSHDTSVSGTTTDAHALAVKTAAVQPRSGDGISLAGVIFTDPVYGFEGRLRMGVAYWQSEFETTTSSGTRSFDDDGFDPMAGVGLWYTGFGRVKLGGDLDFYVINNDPVYLLTAGVEFQP